MIFRVILKVRWNELYYDFSNEEKAVNFLKDLKLNYVGNDEEDQDKITYDAYMTVIMESSTEGSSEEPSETADIEGISTT